MARRAREVMEAVLPTRLHPFVTDTIWERSLVLLTTLLVIGKGQVSDWSFFQQLVAAAATLYLLNQLFRLLGWGWRRVRGPLDLYVENRAIGLGALSRDSGGASGRVGLADILIINREPRRVLIRLSIETSDGESLRAVSHCVRPGVVIDGNPQPHLPVEIPLERGAHARGCAEFLIWGDQEAIREWSQRLPDIEVVLTDLLSGRSLRLARVPRPQSIPDTSSGQP